MENIVRRKPALNMHRCAFTGYRPQKMPFGFNESDPRCIDFKRRVKETIQALYDMGYRHFISGGALGMDMFAAEAVLELRAQRPDMSLEMVSPFDDQAARWSPELRARHDRLFALRLRRFRAFLHRTPLLQAGRDLTPCVRRLAGLRPCHAGQAQKKRRTRGDVRTVGRQGSAIEQYLAVERRHPHGRGAVSGKAYDDVRVPGSD